MARLEQDRVAAAPPAVTGRRGSWPRRATPLALGVLAVVAAFGLQSQVYEGQERTITTVFMFVALAQSWNLIGGYAGYACFGQVVFFGVGGYTTAVLMAHLRLSFWLTFVLSGLAAALFGLLIG